MVNWCMRKVIPLIHSFVATVSATFIVTVIVLIILNNNGVSTQNREIQSLWGSILTFQEDVVVISDTVVNLQGNLTDDFNTTSVLNNTINGYYAFLDNYTCDQIERINNMTPPCNGTFFITGVDGVVVNSGVPANGITLNGTTFTIRMDQQQILIDFIMTTLSIVDMDLATLNMESLKTINNITVDPADPAGNIDFFGECGVDINVTSNGIIIDTCRIQNNASSLVVQLNETYYQILNETEVINATLISVTQIITVLQSQVDALELLIVKNINGIVPAQPSGNVDIVSSDPYIGVTETNPAELTITNLGVNTLNDINLARAVSVVAGPGTTVSVVPPNNVEITNTIADIFETPCTVQAQSSIVLANYPLSTLGTAQWPAWAPQTKTFPSCPDIFNGTQVTQPVGLWTLTISIEGASGTLPFPATCTTICGMSLSYGMQNTGTLGVTWVSEFYPAFTQFAFQIGFDTNMAIVGQILMNGYVTTPGTIYDPVAYFESRAAVAVLWGGVVTATATRIG